MGGKYTEAQARAIANYKEKAIKQEMISLRRGDDDDIISSIKEASEHGYTKRQWLRALFDGDTPSGDLVEKDKVEKLLWEHRIPPQAIKAIMDALK